ncbi:hypothetical protein LMG667_02585 [Xanthomonas euvesicatoria]|uniref:hypothetical protein n=1 Tax=Xanthomonas euvesicatoria TaxID=456327 RepID=UPI00080ED3BB|nr:hypothetical protein [Xanthomonas euvesicatoria]OCG90324.1 hypothetical protein LMG667_02585 [Xanthomonas euvesicatoria]
MTGKANKKNSKVAIAKHMVRSSMIMTGLALIAFVPAAEAAGISDIAKRLAGAAGDMAWLMQVIFMVVGLGFVGGGILGFISDAKQKGNGPVSKGAAAAMLLGGGLLAYMGSLVETAGDTVWGDGKGSRSRIEISE